MPLSIDSQVTGSAWDNAYRAKHEANYTAIKSFCDNLETLIGSGGGSGGGADMSLALQEIFDRRGVIGYGSFDFNEGALSGPNYNLSIAAGAFWNTADFRKKLTATTISLAGKSTGTYYVNVDAAGQVTVDATGNSLSTTRQFAWDAGTHEVSAKALYAGVSILFDGDDYQGMRDVYESVTARLAALAAAGDPFAGYYAQDLPHAGLDFAYQAGKVRNDSVVSDTPAGSVELADDDTNYVEVDPADGTVSANTTGFTAGLVPLYVVTTASGEITGVTDQRTAALVGGEGGGGGHTQNTDTGTTGNTFTLDSDAAGSPTGRVVLWVENGSDANAGVAWNRDDKVWEITRDGGASWEPLYSASQLLGEQEFTRLTLLEMPELVFEDLLRGSSSDVEAVDLAEYFPVEPSKISGVILAAFFWDSAPGAAVNLKLRAGGLVGDPGPSNAVWSNQYEPTHLTLPTGSGGDVEVFVNAIGADTANVRLYLMGYYERVTGAGTQDRTLTATGLAVSASSAEEFNLTGALNRGLAHKLSITETGGDLTGSYDVAFYARDTFLAADLLYQAEGIIPTADTWDFTDWLDWWLRDADGTSELHLKITNNDGVNNAVFSLEVQAEQFA
jgi:hypothetical protein